MFFAKIPRGQGFQEKLPVGSLILGFIAFLLTSVSKFAWGGYYIYPPPSPQLIPTPLSASMTNRLMFYLFLGQREEIQVEKRKKWETIIRIRIRVFRLRLQLHLSLKFKKIISTQVIQIDQITQISQISQITQIIQIKLTLSTFGFEG